MKPSSPDSDSSKNSSGPKLSNKAKFWMGLSFAAVIPVIAAVGLYFAYVALFPNNPRLVVKSVRLAGHSAYWSPADPNERQERLDSICTILNIELGKTQMFPRNGKGADLPAMAAKLREKIPELESVSIRRELPDKLVFELTERKPVANLGAERYIDDDGIVLDKNSCYDITDSLPRLSCNPSIIRPGGDATPFKPGDDLSRSASIRTALDFIRLVRQNENFELKSVFISRNFIQFDFYYKRDPGRFAAILPTQVSEDQIRDDIFGRLIPKLDEAVRNNEVERSLDLRFKDRIIAKKLD